MSRSKRGGGLMELLPRELKSKIIEGLWGKDVAKLECVNSEWRELICGLGDEFWKKKCFADEDWTEMWKRIDVPTIGLRRKIPRELQEECDRKQVPCGWNWKELFGLLMILLGLGQRLWYYYRLEVRYAYDDITDGHFSNTILFIRRCMASIRICSSNS